MHFDLTSSLTTAQLHALQELKARIGDELSSEDRQDDSIFLRFLRAREYNVEKAEFMLRNSIQWRRKTNMDNILTDFKAPEVAKYFRFTRFGFDQDGHPSRFLDFGNTDTKGLLKSCTKEDGIMTVLQMIESDAHILKEQSQKLGRHIETWNFIIDFENYSFVQATHKPTLDLLANLLSTYEANYPERLKQVYIINASIYFTILFAVVKPLLTGTTVSKIKIYGKTGYQEELLRLFHPDVLPTCLGGKRKDADGNQKCFTIIPRGELVPQSYYFRSPERRLACQPGVKKYSVSRMSKINIILDVPEPGSHIEWEFETESRDIGFGLYFRDDKKFEKARELIPKQRVEAHLHSETGMYQCDSPGTYILMFDNSYSWIAQKEIFCRAGVVTPNGRMVSIQN